MRGPRSFRRRWPLAGVRLRRAPRNACATEPSLTLAPGGRAGIRLVAGTPYGAFAQTGFRVGRTQVKPRRIFQQFGIPATWRIALYAYSGNVVFQLLALWAGEAHQPVLFAICALISGGLSGANFPMTAAMVADYSRGDQQRDQLRLHLRVEGTRR